VESARGKLTTPRIVFLVVAGAAPLAAMVGTLPLAFAIGNGPGVPATFAFAGLTLLCFSVGYAAMSRRVVSTGGFYTYVARGLGRPLAVGSGLVALIAYNTTTFGLVGATGYFADLIASSHGLHLHWQVWAAIAIALMALLGYHEIELSAKLLAVLLIGELIILGLLDVFIGVHQGGSALPAASFSGHWVFGHGAGVALMFAFMSFVGFEAAALYGEEARNPRRSVPLATYASVVLIAVFYTVTSWAAVGGVGVHEVAPVAGRELGDLFFGLSDQYLNSAATTAMQVLLCTSMFGAVLALHNASNRYLYALGRDRLLPRFLGAEHPRHGGPHRASLVQTALTVIVVAVYAVAGLDPYVNLATTMLGLGTLAIVVLQATASLSVLGYFRHHADRHWWRTGLAPLLGLAGLVATTYLLVSNFALVTGTTARAVNLLPWLVPLAVLAGLAYAFWLRAARPERYAVLAQEPAAAPTPGPALEPVPEPVTVLAAGTSPAGPGPASPLPVDAG
jgi:amino acid transporter